jgi:hypothetical protein
METALFLDRIGPDCPEPTYCIRLIFLGLCTAIGAGLLIPGVVLAYTGWKEHRMDSSVPGAIILPTALACFAVSAYLFVRWTRQQLHAYRRLHQNELDIIQEDL